MQKHVELVYKGLTLRGTAHIPDKEKEKYPFLAMYHGFTGTRVEAGFKFVQLSRMLEKEGIGSVRFDFSGSGESDGSFENMSITTEVDEAVKIYEYMSALEYADRNSLFLLGFSMGGLVGSLIAPQLEKLKGVVLWAPAGSMYDYVSRIEQESMETGREKPEAGGVYVNPKLLEDLRGIQVHQIAKDYRGDVLLIHGTKDDSVPLEESRKYEKTYGSRSQLLEIEGADHIFSSTVWSRQLLNASVNFLKERI